MSGGVPEWARAYLDRHLATLTEDLRESGGLQPYQSLTWDTTPLRDPLDWCPEHGGTAAPEHCDDDSHPLPPDTRPSCTCGPEPFGIHRPDCPRYVPPLTLPEVSIQRGGITYRRRMECPRPDCPWWVEAATSAQERSLYLQHVREVHP